MSEPKFHRGQHLIGVRGGIWDYWVETFHPESKQYELRLNLMHPFTVRISQNEVEAYYKLGEGDKDL
jgi:hypothetical protein